MMVNRDLIELLEVINITTMHLSRQVLIALQNPAGKIFRVAAAAEILVSLPIC